MKIKIDRMLIISSIVVAAAYVFINIEIFGIFYKSSSDLTAAIILVMEVIIFVSTLLYLFCFMNMRAQKQFKDQFDDIKYLNERINKINESKSNNEEKLLECINTIVRRFDDPDVKLKTLKIEKKGDKPTEATKNEK